jgi:hypothetical protein
LYANQGKQFLSHFQLLGHCFHCCIHIVILKLMLDVLVKDST